MREIYYRNYSVTKELENIVQHFSRKQVTFATVATSMSPVVLP